MIIINSYDLASTLLQKLFHYRELVDAECYRLAYDFVCQILQPTCISSQPEDLLQLPCRSFCREFWNGCGNRLPDKFKPLLDCSNFPEYVDQGGCRAKPGEHNLLFFKQWKIMEWISVIIERYFICRMCTSASSKSIITENLRRCNWLSWSFGWEKLCLLSRWLYALWYR